MSSGEADAVRVSDLDTFRRCGIPGCRWRVQRETVCYSHGGRKVAQYVEGSDGEILKERFMPRLPS